MGQGSLRCRAHAPRANGAGDADTCYNGLAAYGNSRDFAGERCNDFMT